MMPISGILIVAMFVGGALAPSLPGSQAPKSPATSETTPIKGTTPTVSPQSSVVPPEVDASTRDVVQGPSGPTGAGTPFLAVLALMFAGLQWYLARLGGRRADVALLHDE